MTAGQLCVSEREYKMQRILVFCLLFTVAKCSVEVDDWVIARWTNNLYYPGLVNSIQGEWVNVVFVDGDRISHSIWDTSAVIADKEPAGKLRIGQHVLATWKGGHTYYIGFITGKAVDGRFEVTFDDNDEDYYTASQLRFFPEQYSPYEVGARVFARWTNGLYYRGFVTEASDTSVFINYDDGGTITLETDDVKAVILDKIPHNSDVYEGQRVIGFWPGNLAYYPGMVTVKRACCYEAVYHVVFDDGDQRDEDFNQIRLIPQHQFIAGQGLQ